MNVDDEKQSESDSKIQVKEKTKKKNEELKTLLQEKENVLNKMKSLDKEKLRTTRKIILKAKAEKVPTSFETVILIRIKIFLLR